MTAKDFLSDLPEFYRTAFTRDHTALFSGRKTAFSVIRAGTLHLPSGRIVVCDPLIGSRPEPFIQSVLPGQYPVDLSLGRDIEDKIERILFSRVLFTKNEPVIWVKAVRESDENEEAGQEGGFQTISGAVALLDLETADHFKIESMVELDHLLDKLVKNFRPHRSWMIESVDSDPNGVFLASSTVRKRFMPSYFAIDYDGDICLMLTRFYP